MEVSAKATNEEEFAILCEEYIRKIITQNNTRLNLTFDKDRAFAIQISAVRDQFHPNGWSMNLHILTIGN